MWQHYLVRACNTHLALHNANYHTYLSVLYQVRRSSLTQGGRANGGGGGNRGGGVGGGGGGGGGETGEGGG